MGIFEAFLVGIIGGPPEEILGKIRKKSLIAISGGAPGEISFEALGEIPVYLPG